MPAFVELEPRDVLGQKPPGDHALGGPVLGPDHREAFARDPVRAVPRKPCRGEPDARGAGWAENEVKEGAVAERAVEEQRGRFRHVKRRATCSVSQPKKSAPTARLPSTGAVAMVRANSIIIAPMSCSAAIGPEYRSRVEASTIR